MQSFHKSDPIQTRPQSTGAAFQFQSTCRLAGGLERFLSLHQKSSVLSVAPVQRSCFGILFRVAIFAHIPAAAPAAGEYTYARRTARG